MRFLLTSFALATTLATAAPAQTLDRIRESGQFNIGFRADAVPLSYINTEEQPAGYSVLICDRIAQSLANELEFDNLNATFVAVDTKDRFDKIASGEIDILCGAATITLERRAQVDFSIPTYVDGTALLLPKEGGENLSDLAGKKVGMRGATTTEIAVHNSFEQAGIEAEMVPFLSHQAGFKAMADGEIDAYFADQSIMLVSFAGGKMQDGFKMSDQILTIEKHGLALTRGDAEFRLFVDRVISGLYEDGSMEEFFEATLPGIEPGGALQALHIIAPTLP
ncbi:amino acid ABC transporter substrate-binding protein [Ruegeria sp. 2205SS24-7]|uniref:amino acid ABC transporter substrate-binding protein n=1 Tax=Ruegeria discodermiae TaxID=3064389 RepID=UPI0027423045|nr:amino acid ABC transporter substrate-binding protein [Ruegeria sp. 2205SS24-7]MDP5215899.1 amino acid ABC transporter substrate-binding protein [Ruegeria sp. 2205SS24-7]